MKTNDISVENWRKYVYADAACYEINKPATLYISDTGSHRVVDVDGVAHYPRRDWIAIQWFAPTEPVSF